MKVTDVKLSLLKGGNTRAVCSITLDNAFVVKGLALREGKGGLFVAMPGKKGADDKYYDIAFPLSRELREEISSRVKQAYESMLGREKLSGDLPEEFLTGDPIENYLLSAEMSVEDDYDMLDGLINNGTAPDGSFSIRDQLLSDAREQAGRQEIKPKAKEKEAEIDDI